MSALSFLQHLVPPPQYLTLPSAGVDISDTTLKYIRFRQKSGTALALSHWGSIPLPEGTLVEGSVQDVATLGKALAEAKTQIGTQFVQVSLPEERAYIFETTIKRETPQKEIRGLLEFKLEENVPLSPRDAFFDYMILEDAQEAEQLQIVVTVYARETILQYYQACTAAGLIPVAFEVEAQALARAVVPANDNETRMVVDFGKSRTGIGIVHRGTLVYTSTIDIGGEDLSAALRTVQGDTPETEVTTFKNAHGLRAGRTHAKERTALEGVIRKITDGLQAQLQYWHTRGIEHGAREITNVVLCGGSANLRGLPEYCTAALGIPATRASVWQNAFATDVDVPPIDRAHSYGYATAVGLALGRAQLIDV